MQRLSAAVAFDFAHSHECHGSGVTADNPDRVRGASESRVDCDNFVPIQYSSLHSSLHGFKNRNEILSEKFALGNGTFDPVGPPQHDAFCAFRVAEPFRLNMISFEPGMGRYFETEAKDVRQMHRPVRGSHSDEGASLCINRGHDDPNTI